MSRLLGYSLLCRVNFVLVEFVELTLCFLCFIQLCRVYFTSVQLL